MESEITKKDLYSTLSEIIRDKNYTDEIDFTKLNNSVEELIKKIEECEYLINNRRKMNDEEFYESLTSFVNLYFDEFDYYKILELAYNQKYAGVFNMKTTMVDYIDNPDIFYIDIPDTIKNIEFKQVTYNALYTRDFTPNEEYNYTVEDIEELLKDRKVLLLSMKYKDLEDDFIDEGYPRYKTAYKEYSKEFEFHDKKGNFYPYTLKYVRKKFTSSKLKRILINYLKYLNQEIKDVTYLDDSFYYSRDEERFINEYNKEFENEGYSYRLRSLNKNFLEK